MLHYKTPDSSLVFFFEKMEFTEMVHKIFEKKKKKKKTAALISFSLC